MRRLLLIPLLCLLAACGGSPDTEQLRSDLEQRLEQAFGPHGVSLVELRRQGSSSDAKAPAGQTRRLVYFDAQLQLEKPRDFGSWDSPGVASLASQLGTGPRGISGIRNGGNQAGDRLEVHGSLIYQRQADGWQLVAPQGFTQAPQPDAAAASTPPREQLIGAISTALRLSPGGTSLQERSIISEEISRSLSSIEGRISRLQQGYPLASGAESGQYSRFARALASAARAQGITITPLITDGGLQNLQMLRAGDALLALSQSDAAWQAFSGSGAFAEQGRFSSLRVLANLYPEPVQVLVRADGPQSIAELRGKRVNLGRPGSASRDTALAVLAAHDLPPAELAEVRDLELQEALAALRDGQLDALIQVIGLPADAIRAAAEDVELRLLPLQAEAIARLSETRPGSQAYRIPAHSYPRQPAPIATLAVSCLLLADERLSAREAELLVGQLYAPDVPWVELGSLQGAQLSRQRALDSFGMPLHGGVTQALRQP